MIPHLHARSLAATLAALALPSPAAETAITVYSSARPGTLVAADLPRPAARAWPCPATPSSARTAASTSRPGATLLRVPRRARRSSTRPRSPSPRSPTRPARGSSSRASSSTSPAPQKLLSRYLDREITVEQPRGQGVGAFTGTLRRHPGRPHPARPPTAACAIVNGYSGVTLPEPARRAHQPSPRWSGTSRPAAARHARGALRLPDRRHDLVGRLQPHLQPSRRPRAVPPRRGRVGHAREPVGRRLRDAQLKLVAGDVQRAQPRARGAPQPAALAVRVAEAKAEGFAEKAFFEYHLYTLGRPTSLAHNSTKQIELFPTAAGVGCEKALVYYGPGDAAIALYGSPDDRPQFRRPVQPQGGRVPAHPQREGQRPGHAAARGQAARLQAGRRPTAASSSSARTSSTTPPRDETVQVKLGSRLRRRGRAQAARLPDRHHRQVDGGGHRGARAQPEARRGGDGDREGEPLPLERPGAITRKYPRVREGGRAHHPLPGRASRPRARRVVRYTVRYTW